MTTLLFLLAVSALVGATAAYIGSFMVLKRMALVGDALSHVALPGLAIALTLHFAPMLGAFIALTIAVLGVWFFEETSEIYSEALVGIFFTFSLALGVLITPEPELLEALFGDISKISFNEGLLIILFSILIIIVTKLISQRLTLGIVSDELEKTVRVSSKQINLIYLFLVGAIVALGVKFIGTLLMGALVIIPASSAKNISKSMQSFYLLSMLFGAVSALLGVLIANYYRIPSGPIVVMVNVFIFLLTYLIKQVLK